MKIFPNIKSPKICLGCHIEKEATCFNRDGHSETRLTDRCKECLKTHKKQPDPELDGRRLIAKIAKPEPTHRTCYKCNENKDIANFGLKGVPLKNGNINYKFSCKECDRKYSKKCQVNRTDVQRAKRLLEKQINSLNPLIRTCTSCKTCHPATSEYFHKCAQNKIGLQARCKICINLASRKNKVLLIKHISPEGFRKCTNCHEEKLLECFRFQKGKPEAKCKRCESEKSRARKQAQKVRDPEAFRQKELASKHKNKDKTNARARQRYANDPEYRQNTLDKGERFRETDTYKIYREEVGKEYANNWVSNKKKEDPIFKLGCQIRCRTRAALRAKRLSKLQKYDEYIGCTTEHLLKFIESHFLPEMSWDNNGFGEGKWGLDHVMPLSYAETEEELFKLCHFKNLRPMWHIDNIRKSASFPEAVSDELLEHLGNLFAKYQSKFGRRFS